MVIPEIEEMVNEIRNDKISGSSTLARRAVECLDKFAELIVAQKPKLPSKKFINELISFGQQLISAQPAMAAVLRGVNDVISSVISHNKHLELKENLDSEKLLKLLCTFTQAAARKHLVESKLATETIANSYQDVVKSEDTIMTISASGAVETLLLTAFENNSKLTVIIPESRPMNEGCMLAQRLAESGIESILIADSAMFHFLDNCSKIIIGADRVTPKGVVNKIGTYGLAIAAKELSLPFYCVCESTKFVPDLLPLDKLNKPQPESQLFNTDYKGDRPNNLKVENIYFDFTPMKYVTGFLTDKGRMSKNQVRKYIKEINLLTTLIQNLNIFQ